MNIERSDKEIIIRISSSVDTVEIQRLLNLIRYKELTSKFKVKKSAITKIAADVNKKWWKKSAKHILK